MRLQNRTSWFLSLALMGTTACAADSGKGEEEDLLPDGRFDQASGVVQHGELELPSEQDAELSRSERIHEWTFELTDDATIDLSTMGPNGTEVAIDTVMYLFSSNENGRRKEIARNDDSDFEFLWSTIGALELEAGNYTVVVKGYSRRTVGGFQLKANCEGSGCPSEGQNGSSLPPDWCADGHIVEGATRFVPSADGMECEMPAVHCVTDDSSACPQYSPLPPNWCAGGRVDPGAPSFRPSSDGLECRMPSAHCVTNDSSACPQYSPLPPNWCPNGRVVAGEPSFGPSADGKECRRPSVHCVTNDSSACPQF